MILVAGLVAGLGIVLLSRHSGGGDRFDAAGWRQASQEGCTPDNPRLGMYDQLRSRLLRERPAKAEVVAMLGPPDDGQRPRVVGYELGLNIIDCDSVEIRFGPDERVLEVRYVQG